MGFEPTIRCRIHAFQACAFGRSATSPSCCVPLKPSLLPFAWPNAWPSRIVPKTKAALGSPSIPNPVAARGATFYRWRRATASVSGTPPQCEPVERHGCYAEERRTDATPERIARCSLRSLREEETIASCRAPRLGHDLGRSHQDWLSDARSIQRSDGNLL